MFGGANVKVVGKEKNLFVSRKGCKVKAASYKLQAVSFLPFTLHMNLENDRMWFEACSLTLAACSSIYEHAMKDATVSTPVNLPIDYHKWISDPKGESND